MISQTEIAKKVLALTRDTLYLELQYLSPALSAFTYKENDRLVTIATDGEELLFPEGKIIDLFENNPVYLNRLYLHSVLHCLFSHLWLRGERDMRLWNIACDIVVEHTIDSLDIDCTRRVLSLIRTELYKEFSDEKRAFSGASVYSYLLYCSKEKTEHLAMEFFADDHVLWPKEKRQEERQIMLQNKWQNIGKKTRMEQKRHGKDEGDGERNILSQIKSKNNRRSYREFLSDFMIFREELHIDEDEFDIGMYTYGLSMYGNMPLIEPLETREIKKVLDLVVVIDTSYSTSGELVKNFLRETYRLLCERDDFFRRGRLRLIQADDRVQSDVVLQSEDDIETVFESIELKGGGGTDFTPAFNYVDDLVADGAFDALCGLLYFTDGKGKFPKKKPAYKTAFVFLEKDEDIAVPGWAIRAVFEGVKPP